jgi:protein-S-isoprenylcysteine O-methyltransferase Ste14
MIAAYVAYMNRYQIEPEERALLARFGPEYASYMAKVRRWL